ncbi:MAG: lysophospholipase [Deltaproteobacteria bacterium]|nr:MAG: lysophospholipase [Deltaproteobacteria bacterium]
MNPAKSELPAISLDVRVDRDTLLPGRAWCAERPRALVAIVHGLGEHSGRYAALAGMLARARFTCVSLDLPGHGEAPGPRGDIPSWPQLRDHIVPAMFTASRGLPDQPSDLPHVLLGHSMGAVIALDHALAHPRGLSVVEAGARQRRAHGHAFRGLPERPRRGRDLARPRGGPRLPRGPARARPHQPAHVLRVRGGRAALPARRALAAGAHAHAAGHGGSRRGPQGRAGGGRGGAARHAALRHPARRVPRGVQRRGTRGHDQGSAGVAGRRTGGVSVR